MVNGGGYTAFDGATVLQDSVKLDNQVLMDYIIDTLGGVISEDYADPYGQGRIVILEKEGCSIKPHQSCMRHTRED